ncbi:MAG: hypothetical protein K0R50_1943 [Eubacterium sp.]|nr:hypothetical protein [Eubacterium sp.]
MKSIKKIVSLMLILAFVLSFMVGCAYDELALLNALSKQPEINSSESRTELTINLSADGLSDSDKESFNRIAPILNDLKIVINQKLNSKSDKTILKTQSDVNVDMGGIAVSTSVWADADLSGNTPKIKEIIKIPTLLTYSMPAEFRGKSYMVMDTAEMLSEDSLTGLNGSSKEIFEYSKNLTPKLMAFLKDYAIQFNPGFSIVTRKGYKTIDNQAVTVYNLKLDDATFKKLLYYAVKNFSQSDKALNFANELALAYTDVAGLSYKERLNAKGSINKAFDDFKANLPEFLKTCDDMMDVLKDVKILGDKGIDIDFGVNREGYIVSESGSCDFVVDVKAYADAFENYTALMEPDYIKEVSEEKGIYKFGLNFNTVYSKINKDVVIESPKLTDENSFSLKDYMNNRYDYDDFNYSASDKDTNFEEDVTPPAAPTVNKVLKTSKAVTGKAEPLSIITVKKGSTVIGTDIADEKGVFSVAITPVKTKCILTVTAQDFYGNESKAATVNVN